MPNKKSKRGKSKTKTRRSAPKKSNGSKSVVMKRNPFANAMRTADTGGYGTTVRKQASEFKRKGLIQNICAVIDPFCPYAKGAKWPDGNGGETITYQARAHFTPASVNVGPGSANGTLTYLDLTRWPFMMLDAVSGGSSQFTFSGGFSSPWPLIGTSGIAQGIGNIAGGLRFVTAGIVIRNTQTASSSSGYVMVSKVGATTGVASSVNASMVEGTEQCTLPLGPGQECRAIFSRTGMQSQDFDTAVVGNASSGSRYTGGGTFGWDFLKVECVNCAAAQPIDIEIIVNLEFQPNLANQALGNLIPKTAALANPTIVQAAHKVANDAPHLYDGVASVANKAIEKYAASAIDYLGDSFMALLL